MRVEITSGRRVIATSAPRSVVSKSPVSIQSTLRSSTVQPSTSEIVSVTGDPDGSTVVVLDKDARVPAVGASLLIDSSVKVPNGVLGVVTAVTHSSNNTRVTTKPGTLEDAYSSFDAHLNGELGQLAEQKATTTAAVRGHAAASLDPFDVSFSCSDPNVQKTITHSIDLSSLHVSANVAIPSASDGYYGPGVELALYGQPKLDFAVTFTGSQQCKAQAAAKIPIPGTPGLFVEIGPDFTLTGSGSVGANFTWAPKIFYGFARFRSGPNWDSHEFHNGGNVTFAGAAGLKLSLALEAGISLAGQIGIRGALGPEVTGQVSAQSSPPQTCLSVNADFAASLTAFANVFFKDYTFTIGSATFGNLSLYHGCTGAGGGSGGGGGGSGGGAPPVDASPPVIKDLSEPPKIGEVLYAAPGNWLGTVTYYNYQWQRCSQPGDCTPITGAWGAYYRTTPSDVHDTIRVAVSAGNSAGASTPVISAETEEVIEGQCKPASATAEGTVYGWGYNERDELGDGNAVNSSLPVESCISGIREVAAASDDIYALGTNGLVYGWGPSCSGSILATSTDGLSPGVVLGLSNIKQIATEAASAGYALSNDGKVYSWGPNELGQLGDGTTTSRWTPEQVKGLPPISQIYAGAGTAFAVAEDGAVYMWGEVPGATSSEYDTEPTLIPELTEVKRIAAGGGAFLFLHNNGTVESWGSNWWGLLGIGSPNPPFASTRQPVPGLSNVVSLAAGSLAAFAVESNGEVYSWGFNGRSSLGRELPETWSYAPERIPGLPPIAEVAAGGLYGGYALSESGTVYAWGWNESGQLGDGTTKESASPVMVQGLSSVTAITASINDGIAIVGSAE